MLILSVFIIYKHNINMDYVSTMNSLTTKVFHPKKGYFLLYISIIIQVQNNSIHFPNYY